MATAGRLGDLHTLTQRARQYANEVIQGEVYPLTADHVDLSRVTFETSNRMQRNHGVCSYDGGGNCTIRLSETTYDRAGFDAIKQTVRHELVHAYQHQTDGISAGHGQSFKQWVGPLDLDGRCSTHYEKQPEDYKYRFYCTDGCEFLGGRHRWSKAVRRAIEGAQVCGNCEAELRVEDRQGVLEEIPEWRNDEAASEDTLRYQFYCESCGFIGGRKRMCKTVRQVVKGLTLCEDCGSTKITVLDSDEKPVTAADL